MMSSMITAVSGFTQMTEAWPISFITQMMSRAPRTLAAAHLNLAVRSRHSVLRLLAASDAVLRQRVSTPAEMAA
jgi:hypothetical protein